MSELNQLLNEDQIKKLKLFCDDNPELVEIVRAFIKSKFEALRMNNPEMFEILSKTDDSDDVSRIIVPGQDTEPVEKGFGQIARDYAVVVFAG